MNERLKWPDFCKFLAMFLVTWDHASQVISGQIFNNLFGGGGFAAVHMPLFFIISGYFINLEKMRATAVVPFVRKKFEHLMVPAIVWTCLYCLLTMTGKGPLTFLTFYWYLFSLFMSFAIIFAFCKFIKNNNMVLLLSVLTVLFMPYTDIANLNFMFPFLWVGYLLRVYSLKKSNIMFSMSFILTVCLLYIWNWDYTVYLSRFNSVHVTADMIEKFLVRFTIGVSASYMIIWIAKRHENKWMIYRFSQYGQYTLITYVASLLLFGVIRKYIPINIEGCGLLELLSFVLCVITYIACICLQKAVFNNKHASLLLLGINK